MEAALLTGFRITECCKIKCHSCAISHSSIQTDQLSYVIYPLNFHCISKCQTRKFSTCADQFDTVLTEELKASEGELLRK